MVDDADSKKKPIDLPWATIAAVLAATGGLFLYFNPLETSRPLEREGFHSDVNRAQDVDARLWQDPLRTASEHEQDIQWKSKEWTQDEKNREKEHHEVASLRRQIKDQTDSKHRCCWLLPVMIPGSSYAEYAEFRLRIRQAVLEGLGANAYVPKDNEHIGYVKLDVPGQDDNTNEDVTLGWHNVIVPYEWCHREATTDTQTRDALPDDVCVIWLRNDEFEFAPLARLEALFRGKQFLEADVNNVPIRIIGPFASNVLKRMVEEASGLMTPLGFLSLWALTPSPNFLKDFLKKVDMWCPTATAADELLLQDESEEIRKKSIEEIFRTKFNSASDKDAFRFTRCTKTDDEVMHAIVRELRKNRGLHLDSKSNQDAKDRIAVISEWDTFFGRALPLSARKAILRVASFEKVKDTEPKNVLAFTYLRGIDGMLPGPKGGNGSGSKTPAHEATEGLSQVDYLRRLSQELIKVDAKLRHDTGHRIRAIGALGGDVYDKLLVLRALRRTFPGVIFFTNNLDARLAHPDEWRWTRNLLVGSAFGLTLNSNLQKVPPFRDSNQTAFYMAAQLISKGVRAGDFNKDELGPVRLYEVGRGGIFDLTPNVPANCLQPQSPDTQPWWNKTRCALALGILFSVLAAVLWLFRAILRQKSGVRSNWYQRGTAEKKKKRRFGAIKSLWTMARWHLWRQTRSSRRVFGSSWTMLIVLTAVSVFLVWVINSLDWDPGHEPYSWTDGISVWPTETLRLLICLMSIFYLVKTWAALRKNERALEVNFGLLHGHPKEEPKLSWKERAKKIRDQLTIRHWQCQEGSAVNVKKLWEHYTGSGREKIRFARILPPVVCYFFLGILFLHLFGWPEVPARGWWAIRWDWWLSRASALAVVILTVYVADATLLNRRLIVYLTRGPTNWPDGAFNNLRARWRLISSRHVEIPEDDLLIDYLDIDLIARRTEVVGGLIYYPFVIISILILSRASLFDYWTWPSSLLILIVLLLAYATFSAASLRQTAERARQSALQRLNDKLIAYTAEGRAKKKEARTIREAATLIRRESRGAFAAIRQHPLAGALLLPSGSAGIWALLQYFPHLLGG
jgi:hypothetical protein